MFKPYGIASPTNGGALSYADVRLACYTLLAGGICLLPSDTCYAVGVIGFRWDARKRLTTILPGKCLEPIPLAFDGTNLVRQYVKLTTADERLMEAHLPGPLTLVCEISKAKDARAIGDALNTRGTIGVRIPDSQVERQISAELQRPITTCAVRDDSGRPVRSFDDALALLTHRMRERGDRFLLYAVRGDRAPYPEVSTVASVYREAAHRGPAPEENTLRILRWGMIEPAKLSKTLRELSQFDYDDWT